MHFAYIGNFEPPHSTENDVARALEHNGHKVRRYQEGDPVALRNLIDFLAYPQHEDKAPDVVLWTRTTSLSNRWDISDRWRMLRFASKRSIPTVGFHLDRWWGLEREPDLYVDPFFQVDLLFTADGGHDDWWFHPNINHVWMPPAVSLANTGIGTPRGEFTSDIAFVGNWQGGYHPEWKHRVELVDWLQRRYGNRVRFWPKRGEHAIRGEALKDLYASVKVVVGDSCLVPSKSGDTMTRYCSDRIPETLGRGGVLVHPSVEGIDDLYAWHYQWPVGNWTLLKAQIEVAMAGGHARDRQVQFIQENHTYEKRMETLVEELTARGML